MPSSSLQQQDPDELWSMRNQYYVGNYDGVFSEAESAMVDAGSALADEKELFIQLARLAQGELEMDAVQSGVEFKALDLLFQLNREEAPVSQMLQELKRLVDEDGAKNARLRLLAASAFAQHSPDPNDALRILFPVKRDLEVMRLETYLYLAMDRLDLAATKVEEMKQVDEDSTLCQLAMALVGLYRPDQVQESVEVLRELTSKWVPTPLLASALSAGLIAQQKFQLALDAIGEVDDAGADKPAALYLNSICAAQHLGQRLDEHIGGLKSTDPSNAWFADMATSSASFDQAAAKFLQ